MRKLRRVVVMTPTECEAARYACDYAAEGSGMDGDITEADGARSAKASEALCRGVSRCIDLDTMALSVAIDAILKHCSCERRDGKHDAGCFVKLHERTLDRLVSLRDVLVNAP